MSMIRNKANDEGRELGKHLARFCDEAEAVARLAVPDIPPRCNSCAFRHGPHTANGSPTTQMDALKCVIEGVEFQCHEPHRKDSPCSGWAMMVLAKGEDKSFGKVDWPFSDEVNAKD